MTTSVRHPMCAVGLLCGTLMAVAATLPQPPDLLVGPADMPRLSSLLADPSGRPVTSAAEWPRRRAQLLAAWSEYLGKLPIERCDLKPEVLGSETFDGIERRRVRYQVEPDVWVDAYLLRPAAGAESPRPAVVVFHQTTANSLEQPAGLDDKTELHMGVQLARRGYVALCPRCYIFSAGNSYAGHAQQVLRRHAGWKGMTRMLWDGIRAADYLDSLPFVDRTRLGVMGHSLGAKETLYAVAFDARFRVAVASEGGIGLSFSNWEAIWYLGPDIKRPGFALDHHQLIGLIAPRAFLLLAGESADGDRSWAYIDAARPVYRLLGAERSLGWFNHREGHRFSPRAQEVAYGFIDTVLK